MIELDGFEDNSDLVVLGSTNMAESLDPALTRPGRLDWRIEFPLPSLEER